MRELLEYALQLINQDRAAHGNDPVVLGSNAAAQMHAEDMLKNDYQGHWWLDGRKPYMVYSNTGGTSYVAENSASSGWTLRRWREENCDSFLVRCSVPNPKEAIEELQWGMMYDDAHADWGHRDNILGERHRAVNIGVAYNGRRVTFFQHFEGGDVVAVRRPTLSSDGKLNLSVSKLLPGLGIGKIVSIYYDPPLMPMTPAQIDALDSYCTGGGPTSDCGEPVARVLKPPGEGRFYAGLDANEVLADEWNEDDVFFNFTASLGSLAERPGIYTVGVWRASGTTTLDEQILVLTVDRVATTSLRPTPRPSPIPLPPTLTPTHSSLQTPTATPIPTAMSTPAPTQTAVPTPTPISAPVPTPAPISLEELREYAVELINADRAKHGVAPVVLGSNPAAQLHAQEMLEHNYFSRWWKDGRSTYMVYSTTGGTSYVRESIAWTGWREEGWQAADCDSPRVRCDLSSPQENINDIHRNRMSTMENSSSVQRENILDDGHGAVNIGVAFDNKWIVLVHHFEGGDVEADALPSLARDGTLSLSLFKKSADVEIADIVGVYYDPLPTPKKPEMIDNVVNYCIGKGFSADCDNPVARVLKPPGPGRQYANLDPNEVVADEWEETGDSFSFSAPLGNLVNEPGVFTVVVWSASDTTLLTERLLELSVVKKR